MTLTRSELADRVRQLAATLGELKLRVRRAVATETGKAVAETVRDVLTAVLSGSFLSDPYHASPNYGASRARWDDDDRDRSRWDDEDADEYRPRYSRSSDEEPARVERPRWPAVLTLTSAAVKGWVSRRLPGWAAAAVGVMATAAAVIGGPLLQAGLSLAGATADLLPHVFPTHVLT